MSAQREGPVLGEIARSANQFGAIWLSRAVREAPETADFCDSRRTFAVATLASTAWS
jgi:hypothetical protein